jgi:taurine dioxygenase
MRAIRSTSIGPFGIEIDLDLSRPLGSDEVAKLQEMRGLHHLLLFRHQSLSLERQIEVMRGFGPVLMSNGDGVGYVSNVRPDGMLGNGELAFHSDLDFSPRGAYHALSLHAVEVDDDRSSTQFASAARAYQRLDPDLKQRLESMAALDVQLVDMSRRNRLAEITEDTPRLVHPLVRRLPVTGNPSLYASISGTDSIVGLSPDASDALLQMLFQAIYAEDNILEHRWRTGDLIIWDNQALQHRRGAIPAGVRRTLQRVTGAEAGSGFFETFPQFTRGHYATAAT